MLLQHRVSWSHFGDTWALPGGARHEGESATDGAMREAAEEAGVPDAAIRPRLLSVLELGYWSYATLVADVVEPFEPTISDPESRELAWVPVDEVDRKPLHPGFASSWQVLRSLARDPARRRRGCGERDGLGARRLVARPRRRGRAAHPPDRRARRGRGARGASSSFRSTRGSRSGLRSSKVRRAPRVRTLRRSRWCGPRHPETTRSSRRRSDSSRRDAPSRSSRATASCRGG